MDIPKYLTLHKDGCENLKSQNNVVNKTSQLFIRHSLFRLYRPVKGRKVLYCLVLYYGNKTNDYIRRELRITGILDKIDEYGRNWSEHLQRMPQNHKEGEQLEERRNVGESNCNFGDRKDQSVQYLMFMMMIIVLPEFTK